MKACYIALGLLLAVVGAHAQAANDGAMVTIQFDNRGSKVMSPDAEKKITQALAKHVFNVPAANVVRSTGVGQSNLVNHQSVVTYTAVGPTLNGKTPLANCQANTKGSLFSSSTAAKEIKKATDTWAPGDSIKLQSATCAPAAGIVKPAAAKPAAAGRKML